MRDSYGGAGQEKSTDTVYGVSRPPVDGVVQNELHSEAPSAVLESTDPEGVGSSWHFNAIEDRTHYNKPSAPSSVTSRPASPIKRATTGSLQVSDTLQRQASSGIIRKGGVESRIDVITRDYVPPKTQKRSRSQPNVSSAFIAGPFHLHCKLLRGQKPSK